MNMKITINFIAISWALALAGLMPTTARAQSTSCTSTNVAENFTGTTTSCTWNWIGGACLTAGTSASSTSPGPLPQCVGSAYYGNQTQLGGNSGNLNTTPDTPVTGGALRLTNDANSQAGAIISTQPFSLATAGVQISFTTETYEGDSGDSNSGDGADGISFFLQDASNPTVTLGDWGGSLGYTCSNTNNSSTQGYDGMVGGYIGLGIDEFGNFLNGTTITNADGTTTQSSGADNTSTGYGRVWNRIGLRGAGSTAWSWLNTNAATAKYYPSSLNSNQRAAAVKQACQTGYVWDYSDANTDGSHGNTNGFPNPYGATVVSPQVKLANYAAIPNAYKVLTAHKIANESALYRGYGTTATTGTNYGVPITYNLSITTGGLLSLSYSYNLGNFQPIITGQDITASNGSLPASVRFGFAGSTGGSRNIHEIMCFQAQPQNSASSSAGLNQKQTAKVQTGTQVYFAFYNANNWTGDLTSQYLDIPTGGTANDLQIDPVINWSASCNLTGVPTGQKCAKTGVAGVINPQDPDTGRNIFSWTGSAGITFKYANLSSTAPPEQANMNYGDAPYNATSTSSGPPTTARVEYLRGVRGEEQTPQGVDPQTPNTNPSGFRARTSVLGDIVDSSPTWVGPPSVSFPATWTDFLNTGMTMPENSGTSYSSFQSTYAQRTNVVYAGANDGLLHGFRTGHFNSNGTYAGTTTNGVFAGTNNDGQEILAYMPGYVVNTINSSTSPVLVGGVATTTPNPVNDYTNPLYAHKFNVDGTPGTGDLFYAGKWHSWLVGGLGAGGSAIYALDITDPDNTFTETSANAAKVVIGEWQSALTTTTTKVGGVATTTVTGATATFTCAGNPASATCGYSLGKTFGTPQIRRFHNDPTRSGAPNTSWGVVFGNGSGSYNGDAGIFIMMVNTSGSGSAATLTAPTFYYLSTGVGSRTGTPNGIYFVSPADLDGDHVTDYVYAGDLQGNIWRFDLTSTDPSQWAVTKISGTPTPIYTTPGGTSQPITTAVIVATVATAGIPRVLVEFGTGQQVPFTNNSAAVYSSSQQYLMGVWDWNMSSWNSSSTTHLASLSAGTITAPGSGNCPTGATAAVCGLSQLQAQTFLTYDATGALSSQSSKSATNGYYRTVSNTTVCWGGTTGCTGASAQYGWSLALASGYANINDPSFPTSATTVNAPMVYEQVIFNPTLQLGAFIVNTTIPPTTNLAQCNSTLPGGWTMAIDPGTGGAFTNSVFADANHNFLNIGNQAVSAIALSGTGSPSIVTQGKNTYVVTQTTGGTGTIQQTNLPGPNKGKRVTWIQKR
jgi:type IV pilus assembly protein PilY1